MVKSNLESLLGLIEWSNKISKKGRENQKSFLVFCTEYFRQAFLTNNNLDHLTTFEKTQTSIFQNFHDILVAIILKKYTASLKLRILT